MSVRVHIEDHGRNFHRDLIIDLRSDPVLDEKGHRDLDEVNTYSVQPSGSGNPQVPVTFKHRYGDDVYTLVHEAIAAMGVPVDGRTGKR